MAPPWRRLRHLSFPAYPDPRSCGGRNRRVVHLAAGRNPRWGWTAVVVLFTASALGATMFLAWWSRGRKGLYGDHDPAGFYPAEDHFRMRTVQTHGGLADLTWILYVSPSTTSP